MKHSRLTLAAKPLILWYRKNKRAFPWRENPDPYFVWLSEVMSQQTQMASVLPYFYRFIERYPNVHALAGASEDQVMLLWAGLGYYSRARNLLKTAKLINEKYGGKFPEEKKEWLHLPGVGDYTASAVCSIAFQKNVPVFDGNVLRVCARLFAIRNAHTKKFKEDSLKILNEVIQSVQPSDFNQALMELGSQVCKVKTPECNRCPVSKYCKAKKTSSPLQYPAPKNRKDKVLLKVRVLVLRDKKNRLYLQKRSSEHWFSGLMDFPTELGGMKNPKTKIDLPSGVKRIGKIKHNITHHEILLTSFLKITNSTCKFKKGKWIPIDDLVQNRVPLATTAKKILRLLMRQC